MSNRTTTNAAAPKFVSYVRVSTEEQGRSGLGMDAQAEAIRQAVAAKGGIIVQKFAEIASGGDDTRPELIAALKMCKRMDATLIVAKLDRLSRDVELIAGTMKRTPLVVAECVGASPMELHLRASFAEEERNKIRTRTREALAALKARGVKLGSARPGHWKGREDARQAGLKKAVKVAAAKRRELSADTYQEAAAIAATMPGASLRTIAAALNDRGITTARGASWTAAAVSRMMAAV